MSKHYGDFDTSTVVYGKFTTYRPSTGAPYTLAGTPALSVYKDNSTTQSTTGVTLTVDFDSVTGLHHFAIDTSADGTFYAAGSFFEVVITTGTVDSVSAVGTVVGSFTIRKTSALKPTTAGRALDVSAGGEAGVDWGNVGSPTTTLNLSGTTIKTATDVETDTQDIQSRLPAALGANGNIKADARDWIGTALPTPDTNGYPKVTIKDGTGQGELDTALGTVITGSLAAGIAASIASAVRTEIATELARIDAAITSRMATFTLPTNFSALAINASGHVSRVTLVDTCTTNSDMIGATGIRSAIGMASANLDTQIGTLATSSALSTVSGKIDTVDDFIDTEVAAIKAKTDNLPASPAATGDVTGVWTTAMTESYAADGATATPAQMLYMIWSFLQEFGISGTTLTAKKLDGSTTSMTFTLNDATSPTAITRAT